MDDTTTHHVIPGGGWVCRVRWSEHAVPRETVVPVVAWRITVETDTRIGSTAASGYPVIYHPGDGRLSELELPSEGGQIIECWHPDLMTQ